MGSSLRLKSGLLTLAVITLAACRPHKDTYFDRLSPSETGVDFINWNEETESANILTYEYLYNGGGVAIGDINNDGFPDIYLSSNSYENKLYLNKGGMKFEDITEQSGTVCEPGWKTGVSMADINGDGWLDIYVCRSAYPDEKMRTNLLYINNGDLTFTEKAAAFGLDDNSYTTQAAFFDYDHDGDLDALILNHSLLRISNSYDISQRNTRTRTPNVGNRFLRNDNGHFTDVSDSVGVYGPASNYGLGVSISDITNDGWLDMYLGCDYTGRDRLLINEQGRRFFDATDSLLSHISKFTMGTDIADINGDGWMDIYTLDMLPEGNKRQKQLFGADRFDVFNAMVRSGLHYQYMRNMLQLNDGNGAFSEIGQLAGVSNTDWSWAALFADYDNDGVLDLFVSNGFKRDLTDNDFAKYQAQQQIEAAKMRGESVSYLKVIEKFKENKIHNYVFRGNGDLTFTNVVEAWGMAAPTLTNGVAYADLDNDGDLDFVMNNVNARADIYRNNTPRDSTHHYLEIILHARGGNTGAIGSRATLFAGSKSIVRELLPVRGFQSSVDPRLHFGLGSLSHIDSVRIRWPDGSHQTLFNVSCDQLLAVEQDSKHASSTLHGDAAPKQTLFTSTSGTISFVHHENTFVDFNIQPLLPRAYSTQGPALASADIDGDGIGDLFIGGAKGQHGAILKGSEAGGFIMAGQKAFQATANSEDVDALFFDMDKDGDMDLYVVSGGFEYAQGDSLLKDHLYENRGAGGFVIRPLPDIYTSGSCVRASDYDQDGDIDLFVGGRIVPGKYPLTPESHLLLNDGSGNLSVDARIPESLAHAGMVTDAVWMDLNGDHYDDLIVVGEWMPIRVYINNKGILSEQSAEYFPRDTEGWWNCILAGDFDGDGDMDLFAGNFGMNNQMGVTGSRPATMVFDDFDHNGSVDPVLCYFVLDESFPYPTRDELAEQLPFIKRRFPDYSTYSNATISEVFSSQELSHAGRLAAYTMKTSYFENNGGHFTIRTLPEEIQFAPVFSLLSIDANGDGHPDVIATGNLSATRARTGKATGNTGFLFLGDGAGDFRFVPPSSCGLNIHGDVRHAVIANQLVIFAINNAAPEIYQINNRESQTKTIP